VADEVFLTGTAAEVTPVRSVDRTPVGAGCPGPVTVAVQKAYLARVHGSVPDPYEWLTLVETLA
jgi:branched-chain amino acid aminotransferase